MRNINIYIKRALAEDIFPQDITTQLLVAPKSRSIAHIVVKENAIVCGLAIARAVFIQLDAKITFKSLVHDGARVKKNTKIAVIKGKTRALLTGERTALNFLSHLCGIATKTNRFVKKVKPYKVKIMDTRKTIPGLRALEKYAVKCGGGMNHRSSLHEMVFIKDNHRDHLNIDEAIRKIRKKTKKAVEVEVDTIPQLKQALKASPDVILLDNMTSAQMKKCIRLVNQYKGKKPKIEASGRITLKNVASIARLGVDCISIGALTHSVQAVDVSLEMI